MRALNILVLIMLCCSGSALSQDGMARWIQRDSLNSFVSLFNSAADLRARLADSLAQEINLTGESRVGPREFLIEGCLVRAELFVLRGGGWELWDLYVDEIIYPDGRYYKAERWPKPTGPEERYLQK